MFELHPVLKKDTIFIRDLQLCQLVLMNNIFYPWVILIPKENNLSEIIDLSKDQQNLLMQEIDLISRIMKTAFSPDKLNIAALGNMVPQLHIHIIARYKTDRVFPKPVWVDNESKPYEANEVQKIIETINDLIDKEQIFTSLDNIAN
jgi:diadenosine tetraphosphate (Ap4A) HIT family hydrolase